MITRTVHPVPSSAPRRAGAGALALLLSLGAVPLAQSQATSPASPTSGTPAPSAPQATPVQAERTQQQRSTVPAPQQVQQAPGKPAPAATPIAQPPAVRNSAGETTRASQEADAANADMQAELEPTPGGLTAEEVIRLAFENSPSLEKATLEVDRTAANEARAKLAFAPRLDVGAGYTRLSKVNLPPFDLLGALPIRPEALLPVDPNAPAASNPFVPFLNVWSVTASVSLPITDIFLSVIPTYKATKKLAKVAELQREAQKLQLSYDARVAYYEYARLRGNVSVARASVRVREAGVRDLEALVQAGTATGTELVRAQAELAGAQALETQARGGVEVARARLEQLMGVAVDPNRGVGEPFVGIDIGQTPTLESVRNEAKAARPELLALNMLVQGRNLLLRARKGGLWPKLTARGDMLYGNPNPRYVPPLDEWKLTGSAGVTIGWSPNDFALAYTQATDAEIDLQNVYQDQRAFELGIVTESASAVTGHATAAAQIQSTTQALEAARRYEADQRALLLAGAATPNDVLLAQRDLLGASLNWVNAFIAGRTAEAALLKVQGKTGLAK